MRSLSSGLLSGVVAGVLAIASMGEAEALGGAGVAGGRRAGSGAVHRGAMWGRHGASFGRRIGAGGRLAFGYGGGAGRRGYGRGRTGYAAGYLGVASYIPDGYLYGAPYPGWIGPAFDPGPPTSIGIPAPPVAPPAIYVLGEPGRAKSSGRSSPERQGSGRLAAGRGEAASGAVGPRIIRITR